MVKNLNFGLILNECIHPVPCKHCAIYDTTKGHGNLDFSLIEKAVNEINADENLKISGVSISGGEALLYNWRDKTLVDVVNLFPEDAVFAIATEGAICKEAKKSLEGIKDKIVRLRLSYHEFTNRNLLSGLVKTLNFLEKIRWPLATEQDANLYLGKEIQVSGRNPKELKHVMGRLVGGMCGHGYEFDIMDNTPFFKKDSDIILVRLSNITYVGLARENFKVKDFSPIKQHQLCPSVTPNDVSIALSGVYNVCDFTYNSNFPQLGHVRDTTVQEVIAKKEKIPAVLDKMFAQPKADLTRYGGQRCAYCVDHLKEFMVTH
jgi:hypothetical protein